MYEEARFVVLALTYPVPELENGKNAMAKQVEQLRTEKWRLGQETTLLESSEPELKKDNTEETECKVKSVRVYEKWYKLRQPFKNLPKFIPK